MRADARRQRRQRRAPAAGDHRQGRRGATGCVDRLRPGGGPRPRLPPERWRRRRDRKGPNGPLLTPPRQEVPGLSGAPSGAGLLVAGGSVGGGVVGLVVAGGWVGCGARLVVVGRGLGLFDLLGVGLA